MNVLPKKGFCRLLVIMHAAVEDALSVLDLLCDVIAVAGDDKALTHAATTMPWNGISQA